jgi:hypothetical protein
MKFKRFLIVLFALCTIIFVIYAARVYTRIHGIFHVLNDPVFWIYGFIAFACIMLGHWLRASKAQRLLAPVKISGTRTQFQALLIGYLFNTILPFRLGEVVRAIVLGRSLKISSSFMFALIVLERSVDGLILGLLCILAALLIPGLPHEIRTTIMVISLGLVAVSSVLVLGLKIMYRQNVRMLRYWHSFTEMFNYRLKNSLRFKMWSAIYGMNKLFNRKRLSAYVARAVVMWIVYLAGPFALALYFFHDRWITDLLRSLITFLGVSVPSGPAFLGSYQAVADPLFQALAHGKVSLDWLVASWMLLALPSSLLGVALLIRHRTDYSKLSTAQNQRSLQDKLARVDDISQEFDAFLDQYFRRNTLSHILHRLEINENMKLIRYFKGGSNASTLLVHQNNEYVVKKITPIQYAHRLKAQHKWLKDREHLDKIVNVTREREDKDFYYIDIEYHADLIPFFDYIHSNSIDHSKDVLSGVFRYLFDYVYELEPLERHANIVEEYINNKVKMKLDQAARLNLELGRLRDYDKVVVNGVEYINIGPALEIIRHDSRMWKDVCTYRESPIHGDTQIDNILASIKDHTFKIIDPVDQNEVSSPVVDCGRMFQSLIYGYEFLCRDDSPVTPEGNSVRYEDSVSAAYRELSTHFKKLARELLEPEEYRAVLFHTAVHYSRMCSHRVEINPANASKFYAVSVRAFNDFIAQYD